jgi:deoxycytidine triphosphate deaminase
MGSLLKAKEEQELNYLRTLTTLESDPRADPTGGVLLSEEIEYFAVNHQLIEPFSRDNLKPAAYELTVGVEYFIGGEYLSLDEVNDKITIPPFDVAVIKTGERVCIPRFLIARWNIKVGLAYQGLLWVGGPQVDAGYKGFLFCPIYNLSDKPVSLRRGDQIAVIDFSTTTPFKKDQSKEYDALPKRPILEKFGIDQFKSGLFTRAGQKIAEFEDTTKSLEARFTVFTQISFVMFSMMIATLAFASKLPDSERAQANLIVNELAAPFAIGFSVWAVLVTLFSYFDVKAWRFLERLANLIGKRSLEAKSYVRKTRWMWLVVPFVFAAVAAALTYRETQAIIGDQSQRGTALEARLADSAAKMTALESDLGSLKPLQGNQTATAARVDDLTVKVNNLAHQIDELTRALNNLQSVPSTPNESESP